MLHSKARTTQIHRTRGLIVVWLAVVLAGCGPASSEEGRQDPGTAIGTASKPSEVASGNPDKANRTDALFVHQGVLYGLDVSTWTVKELVPVDGSGQKTESAMFARDGKSVLLHRNWVGGASWWAAKPDGSGLRQLPVMGGKQTGPVARLRDQAFVGCFKGEQLVLFDLSGTEPIYQSLEHDARCQQSGQLLVSPDAGTFAFSATQGVIIAGAQDNSIKIVRRVPGQTIYGWLSDTTLATGDSSNLYIVHVSTGQTKQVNIQSVLPSAARLTGVTINPTGKSLYITGVQKVGGASTIAVNPQTLAPLSVSPVKQPDEGTGPTVFSPRGSFAVWNIPGTRGVPVAISRTDTGEVFLKTNETTVPVPYVFHPNDTAILYSRPGTETGEFELHLKELSGKDQVLWKWDSTDSLGNVEWNPTSSFGK